jgi:hypothetical protein
MRFKTRGFYNHGQNKWNSPSFFHFPISAQESVVFHGISQLHRVVNEKTTLCKWGREERLI